MVIVTRSSSRLHGISNSSSPSSIPAAASMKQEDGRSSATTTTMLGLSSAMSTMAVAGTAHTSPTTVPAKETRFSPRLRKCEPKYGLDALDAFAERAKLNRMVQVIAAEAEDDEEDDDVQVFPLWECSKQCGFFNHHDETRCQGPGGSGASGSICGGGRPRPQVLQGWGDSSLAASLHVRSTDQEQCQGCYLFFVRGGSCPACTDTPGVPLPPLATLEAAVPPPSSDGATTRIRFGV